MGQYSFTLVLSFVIAVLLSGQVLGDSGCNCSGYTPDSCGGYYCYNQDTGAKITWGIATGDCRDECCGSSNYAPKYVPAKIWLNKDGTAMGGWCCPGNPDTPCTGSSEESDPVTTTGSITTNGEMITKSIILLFDASGSMADDKKIINAKSAAKNAIDALSNTTEIALIVFSDCGKIDIVQPFTTDKKIISSKISQIIADGSTPLADALDYANDYKKNARSNERTIVLFTDGIETCR